MANFYGQFIGFGAGGVAAAGWAFQGEAYGYSSGGWPGASRVIDRFSFDSGSEDADTVGDLSFGRTNASGLSSELYGYTAGGRGTSWPTLNKNIDKFSFASGTESGSDSGDLTTDTNMLAGTSSPSFCYMAGGSDSGGDVASIQKFSAASGGNSSAITGVLTSAKRDSIGVTHTTHGYTVGARRSYLDEIERFSFDSEGDSVGVGVLGTARSTAAGQSSTTDGFVSGGTWHSHTGALTVEKWSFDSGTESAAGHGNLSRATYSCVGQSSQEYGYTSGGYTPSYYENTIDRFAYSSNSTASDVGSLTTSRGDLSGHQV